MPIGPARPGRSLVSVAVLHPQEHFTPGERERLRPYFTDLDAPVFGLVNLPETVKAAMFARYSRYPGTLRRLFLDEFADSVAQPAAGGPPAATAGGGARRRRRRAGAGRASCSSASSSATGMTRWPSSAARTSPASGCPTS